MYKKYPNENIISGLAVLESLINFYGFSNKMTVKELNEYIREKLWIEQFKVKFRIFNIVKQDKLIGKVTAAMKEAHKSISNNEEEQTSPNPSELKLAFAFWNARGRDVFSKSEGKKWALHRLLCNEQEDVITNSRYTKLNRDFLNRNIEVQLPFQAYIENVSNRKDRVKLIKEAIVKVSNSMRILWMSDVTVDDIK